MILFFSCEMTIIYKYIKSNIINEKNCYILIFINMINYYYDYYYDYQNL